MALLQQTGVSSPLARILGLASLAFATAVAWPSPAAAHVGCCLQCVNPHGKTIPPAGSAIPCDVGTMPSDEAGNAGVNPDGFFQIGTTDGTPGAACLSGTSDVKLFSCASVNASGQCTDTNPTPICENGDPSCIFEKGTLIKFTEANGAKTPTVEDMGSNNGGGFGGQGGAVEFRIKASGDLMVCSADNPTACTVCPVPPPAK